MDVDFRGRLLPSVGLARLAGHLILELQMHRVGSIKSSKKKLTELSDDTLRALRYFLSHERVTTRTTNRLLRIPKRGPAIEPDNLAVTCHIAAVQHALAIPSSRNRMVKL
jgi:hypothetical protein